MRSPARRTVVVVGSGIAGLTAAIHAARDHDVVLVTAGDIEDSNTWYAQGGIAGAIGPGDSVAAHIADTVRAGAGLCAEDAVRVLCAEAPDRLRELIDLGVPFDRIEGRPALGLEAAHSAARILHAGGDATGAAIEGTLAAITRERVALVLERTSVTDLVVADGVVSGVRLRDGRGDSVLAADAVILATGGFAGLYEHTSNPPSAVGAGIALAVRAGAAVADVEFVQFHPTVLATSGGFLVSEAVRGEGAVLRDEHGERFLLGMHPDAELAPRDVVARAIAETMRRQGGRPVLLDATHLDGARLDARFPGIARRVRAAGIEWTREPVPVTPAAHYTMGGIATDLVGRTTLPGLLAVGEVARTGVHGANRLASNSLVEGAVFGARAAAALSIPGLAGQAIVVPSGRTSAVVLPEPSVGRPFPAGAAPSPALGRLLWQEVGLSRSDAGLRRALAGVAALASSGEADHDAATVASLVVHAALERRESRGAHARSDFPMTDPTLAEPRFLVGEPSASSRQDQGQTQEQDHDLEEATAC